MGGGEWHDQHVFSVCAISAPTAERPRYAVPSVWGTAWALNKVGQKRSEDPSYGKIQNATEKQIETGYPETPRWEPQALRPRGPPRPRRPRGAPGALTQRLPNGNPDPETPTWHETAFPGS